MVDRSCRRFRCFLLIASAWFAFPAGGTSDGMCVCLGCGALPQHWQSGSGVMQPSRRTYSLGRTAEPATCNVHLICVFRFNIWFC